MEKIKELLKSFVAVLVIMIGVICLNFYMTHTIGIVSILVGGLGFFILHPAVEKWKKRIWGKDANL
jgi:hypothetical protein